VMQVMPPSPMADSGLRPAESDDESGTWLRSDMTLGVVSDEVDNAENECPICAEKPAKMQQLKQCGHKFCKNCLYTQMHTDIQSNYKCGLCRKPMRPVILNGVSQRWNYLKHTMVLSFDSFLFRLPRYLLLSIFDLLSAIE
jgi:hypothetical protein